MGTTWPTWINGIRMRSIRCSGGDRPVQRCARHRHHHRRCSSCHAVGRSRSRRGGAGGIRKIRADLIQHADACDAVGRAASTGRGAGAGHQDRLDKGPADGRPVGSDHPRRLRRHLTWDRARPRSARKWSAAQTSSRPRPLLVTRANAADADLASAIRGAAGQETPAQIYDKLGTTRSECISARPNPRPTARTTR